MFKRKNQFTREQALEMAIREANNSLRDDYRALEPYIIYQGIRWSENNTRAIVRIRQNLPNELFQTLQRYEARLDEAYQNLRR